FMRAATPTSSPRPAVAGDVPEALANATKVVEAQYDFPFQGHTALAPAHAMADPSNDQLTIYSNDMKSYGMRSGVAQFLQMPRDRVRVVWLEGPQGYGRTAADDAGFEAAYLAKEIGRPVRVQWMRDEETAWDTKGPAYAVTMRGGLDAQGNLIALEYDARAADYNHVGYNEADTVLIAQLMGNRRATPNSGGASLPSDMYAVANRRMAAHVVAMPLVWVKRLVCAHDCGLAINPEALRRTIEGALLHSVSRALHEEVRFDTERVTSVDWNSSPTLTHADAPETIDVVLVNGDPNPNRP